MAKFRFYVLIGLIVLAIGAGTVVMRYFREINAARQALDRQGGQVIDTDCGRIEYAQVGEGYPVLMVHGAMGGFDQGLLLAYPVVEAGFQAIAVSRFGYLGSPIPQNADLNLQADAFACLLDALGIQEAAVFGTSAGATASMRFAARYPERTSALVLLSPAAPGETEASAPPRVVFDTFMRSDFLYWLTLTYFKPSIQAMVGVPEGFGLTPAYTAEVDRTLASTLPVSGRMDGMIFDTDLPRDDFRAPITETSPYAASKIKTPVLLINALDDPLALPANVRGLADQFPNGRLLVIPDGGHLLLGHSAEVNTAINQFLKENTRPQNAMRK